MLISPEYVKEQQILHRDAKYGAGSDRYAYLVAGILDLEHCRSMLDYGCGKGALAVALWNKDGVIVQEYDPAIPGKDDASKLVQSDLVTCIDVMEHIEPKFLVEAIRHLHKVTRRLLFLDVALKFDKHRKLTDGRNSHQVVEEAPYWSRLFQDNGFLVKQEWPNGLRAWIALLEKK